MNELQEFIFDKKTQVNLISFLKQYGIHGLEQALKAYINCQQEYICKNNIKN